MNFLFNNYVCVEEIRDIKIRLLSGEDIFNFNSGVLKSKSTLDFISKNFKNDIISGSFALSLYGFITDERPIGDIDLLIKDKNRYSDYKSEGYDDFPIPNRLGYKTFEYKRGLLYKRQFFDVDFFIEPSDTKFDLLPLYDLKVHSPIQIINHKIKMINKSYKHRTDLYYIFKKLNYFS
jgi:hypothetical protein